MKQILNFSDYINRKRHHRAQRWIAGFLACVVGFSVTFSLIQPAATMERSCAIEEHQHGDGCYTHQTTAEVTSLTCSFAPHVHEAPCGDSCGYADFAVHSHSDLCYDGDALGALDCELESRDPHFHGDGCYLPMPVCTPEDPDSHVHEDSCFASTLACALEETEGHIHSEACHIPLESLICTEDTETLVLVCGLPEIALHTHTDGCFATQDAEQVLTCPLTEVLRHNHDESCLTVTTVPADIQVLTCTMPEHIHSDACRQASTDPVETLPVETLPVETQPVESQPQSGFFALRPTTMVDSGTFLSTEGNELSWELIKYTLTGEHTLTISGKDAAFSFVIFEGNLPEDSFATAEELAQLLDAAGKAYHTFSLPMEAGSSLSDYMDPRFDGWNWKEGQTYSLVEILEDDAFSFRKFLGTGASCYTFTYDPGVQQQILCENTLNHWSVELTKTDPTGKGLEDGVFGLYSPNAADQISGEAFNAPEQLTYNGITWYLSHIGTTDENGCILWQQLEHSSYYLLEIQLPPGHVKGSQPGQLLYRSAAEEGVYRVNMVNEPGYALPHTGSIGTAPLTIPGLLLMAAAVIAFLYKKKLSY